MVLSQYRYYTSGEIAIVDFSLKHLVETRPVIRLSYTAQGQEDGNRENRSNHGAGPVHQLKSLPAGQSELRYRPVRDQSPFDRRPMTHYNANHVRRWIRGVAKGPFNSAG